MVEEWLTIAQTFSGIGFFGITSWLLIERHGLTQQQIEHDAKMGEAQAIRDGKIAQAQVTMAEAIDNIANTNREVVHIVDKQTDAIKDLREEIRLTGFRKD